MGSGLWVVDSSEAVRGGRTRQLTLGAPAASETETEVSESDVVNHGELGGSERGGKRLGRGS